MLPSRFVHVAAAAAVLCVFSPAAMPWGRATEASIVTAAANVLSRGGDIPLVGLLSYIRDGAIISEEQESQMFPTFGVDPIGAIETEMYLLQAVRGRDRIDPYFAFRLGALGKMIARATAPLASRSATHRDAYYADIDERIDRIQLVDQRRMQVDPQAYFARVVAQARAEEETILREYQSGERFSGYARASAPEHVSRSIHAVADTWETILTSGAAVADVSRANMREYALNALGYYLSQRKTAEVRDAYQKIFALGVESADVRKRIGDLYYEHGYPEPAMEEYKAVLALEPDRRDIKQRMAIYYEQAGDAAIEERRLEAARDFYAAAVESDKLHPTAQRKLMDAEKLIVERDARLAATREAIETAQQAALEAETLSLNGKYAEAIVRLRLAQQQYETVTGEFPNETARARSGLDSVLQEIEDCKRLLVANVQQFSGAAQSYDAGRLAAAAPGLSRPALDALVRKEFEGRIAELQREFDQQFRR